MTSAAGSDGDLVTVEIRGLPVVLQSRLQEHVDELTREFTLMSERVRQRGGDDGGLPARLVELVTTLTGSYSSFTEEQERELAAAALAGRASLDLTYRLPRSASDAAAELGALLAEADEYCRGGQHLLTLATPPDLARFRDWFLGQFVDQVSGRPPVSWPDHSLRAPAG
jgi:hypothetical protein